MTTDTVTTNQNNSHLELDQSYDEYVKKAVQEGLKDIKAGRTHNYKEVMNEFMKDD